MAESRGQTDLSTRRKSSPLEQMRQSPVSDIGCQTISAMNPADFDRLVERAYAKIPAHFRARMRNVALVVEPEPPPLPGGGTLLGLYQGRPLTGRSVFESFAMPDRITIYQGPHERLARSPEHLQKLVEETVWHEIAHYFGMDERQVRAAERRRRTRRRVVPPRGSL